MDGPVRKQIMGTIDKIVAGDPTTMAQTHPLTGPLKGWSATKASRGHRVVHRPTDDGIHVGYVGLHDYDKAIQRLTSIAADQPRLWPQHPLFRPGDRVVETTDRGRQFSHTVHHQEEPTDPDHPGTVWLSEDDSDRGLIGVHPHRLSPHPEAPPEQHEHYRAQQARNAAGEPYVPEAERHIDTGDTVTVHHLTDRPDFALDPTFRPQNNTTMGGDLSPRLFVGNPHTWATHPEYGYRRPYVAEIQVPRAAVRDEGGYAGEKEILGRHYDKAKVTRVMPYDAYHREQWGEHGPTETHAGTEFDTGKPITGGQQFPSGYRWAGDTRTWSPAQHREHLRRHREYLHDEHGWGWNEFDQDHNHVGLPEDSWDQRAEEYVRTDRHGNPMTQRRSSKTAGSRSAAKASLPAGITYTPIADGESHGLVVEHPEHGTLGMISWGRPGHFLEDEITHIEVHPAWQRRGLATQMWNRARAIRPNLMHTDNRTRAGHAWARSVTPEVDEPVIDLDEEQGPEAAYHMGETLKRMHRVPSPRVE